MTEGSGMVPTIMALGDEFTKSTTVSSYTDSLSTQLNTMTGVDWEVKNYGNSDDGAITKTVPRNFWWTQQYNDSRLETDVEWVVMMFGHNDAKQANWNEGSFKSDYIALCNEYKAIASQGVFIVIPPPVYQDEKAGIRQFIVNDHIPGILK